MNISILKTDEVLLRLSSLVKGPRAGYLAMYSSWLGGITKDPAFMIVPVDDHIVHRGDGVFEAVRFAHGNIYLLDAHLDRLQISSNQLGIAWPCSRAQLVDILMKTVQASGSDEAMLRIYLSRGPGGFTTNPYESVGAQLYVVATHFRALPPEKYVAGVAIGRSLVAPKDPWFATVKSCNYLPNVMMKKEAVDRALDFTIGFDADGIMTESSTENIMLLDAEGFLVRPKLAQILKGTTMMRALDLAARLVDQGVVRGVMEKDLREADLFCAREVMMVGTTLDVLPVTSYEGRAIGAGSSGNGEVAKQLRDLILKDMRGKI